MTDIPINPNRPNANEGKVKCRHCGMLVEDDGSDGHFDRMHATAEEGDED